MPVVELIYDSDCPNVAEARAQLLRAFAGARMTPAWREWCGDDESCPAHARGYGSPTILVDGDDVAAPRGERGSPAPEASGRSGGTSGPDSDGTAGARGAGVGVACCRLYASPDGALRGVPSVSMIQVALERHSERTAAGVAREHGRWKVYLATIPGILAALLPNVACPACWPAYAGFLSAAGLGFLLETTYLLPLTALCLLLAVGALAFRAPRRRGYRPFVLGVAAAAIVLSAKFWLASDPAMYGGLVLLVAASIWNGWPRRSVSPACASCSPRRRDGAARAGSGPDEAARRAEGLGQPIR